MMEATRCASQPFGSSLEDSLRMTCWVFFQRPSCRALRSHDYVTSALRGYFTSDPTNGRHADPPWFL
jgi:hypothetical protein